MGLAGFAVPVPPVPGAGAGVVGPGVPAAGGLAVLEPGALAVLEPGELGFEPGLAGAPLAEVPCAGGGCAAEEPGGLAASAPGGGLAVGAPPVEGPADGVDVADGVEVAEAVGAAGAVAEAAGVEGLAMAGCGAGDLNVPVAAVDFVGAGACGGKTSTDSVKVRFSAACRAPTLTTWRVTSSPRSLRMAMITKYSSGCSSGGWRMMPSTRNAGAAATWRFAASESKRRWCMQPGQILRLSRIVALQ